MGVVRGTSNQGKAPLFSAKELTFYYQIESRTSIISITESSQPGDGAADTRTVDSHFLPRVSKSGTNENRHLTSIIIDLEQEMSPRRKIGACF